MKARLHRLDSHYVLCQVLAIFVRYVQVAIVEGFVEKRPLRLYRWIRMSTLFHAGFQSAALAIPCGEEGRFVSSFSWLFSLSYWFHSGISVATRTSLLSYPSWFLFFCLTGSDCSSSFIGYTEFIVFTHLGAEGWFRSSRSVRSAPWQSFLTGCIYVWQHVLLAVHRLQAPLGQEGLPGRKRRRRWKRKIVVLS